MRGFYSVRCGCGATFIAAEFWTMARCACGKLLTLHAKGAA